MKNFLRYGGIVLVICGLILYMVFGVGYDNNAPTQVTSGVVIDGKFKPISSGAMGGNSENQDFFSNMQTVSLVCAAFGGVMFLASFALQREE